MRKNRVGLTKYVVGAKANPPKNPSSAPKNGNVIAINIVKAAKIHHHVMSSTLSYNLSVPSSITLVVFEFGHHNLDSKSTYLRRTTALSTEAGLTAEYPSFSPKQFPTYRTPALHKSEKFVKTK